MEYKNEVRLRGILTEIRPLPRGNRTMYQFKVKTLRAFVDKDGNTRSNEEEHHCVAWPGRAIPAEKLRALRPGNIIFVTGHLCYKPQTYVFAESLTVSKESATGMNPSMKI